VNETYLSSLPFSDFYLWKKVRNQRPPISFGLELTARCNNDCRHCYINLPVGDKHAKETELTVDQISEIADEGASLGVLWCLITGGEPFLRPDFREIYTILKRKGFLVSVFTNATLINKDHIQLFKMYPPRDIEVTVYGVTEETYERVTRKSGSFAAFVRGLDLLLESGVQVRLKAMALRSNIHEFSKIVSFCIQRTKDYFRFDPFLHLRFDGNPERNSEIKSERLSPEEIVALERADPKRFASLEKECDRLIAPEFPNITSNHLFRCGAGNTSFTVGPDGFFRLCSSLYHPDCIYDLRKGNLLDAWNNFITLVRNMRSNNQGFLETCRVCPLINLCLWCPAHAYLETGELDAPVDYFCKVAHARAKALTKAIHSSKGKATIA